MVKFVAGIRTPLKVAHYITYKCNLSCDMCGRRAIESEKELLTSEVKSLQKMFSNHGTIAWSFSGGECLLRKDIIELSKYSKELGMDLLIITNGTLLPKKKDILKYADVINISIDGNKGTHEHLRGKGSYDLALRGLEVLKNNGRKKLKKVINTILNNETIELNTLEHMLDLAKDYSCQVGFNPIIIHRPDLRNVVDTKYFPTLQQFNIFHDWLREKLKTNDKKYFVDKIKFFESIGDYPNSPTRIKCYAGKFQLAIDPFGKVLPCSDFFDYETKYKKSGFNWKYGYKGFENLEMPKCPYGFCCTAKKNFFFDHPLELFREYVLRKSL